MNKFFAKIACKVKGHDWTRWNRSSLNHDLQHRYCKRGCGTPTEWRNGPPIKQRKPKAVDTTNMSVGDVAKMFIETGGSNP
jgi:hypothetical protein